MGKISPLPSPARAYQCPPIALPESAVVSNSWRFTIHEQIQQLYRIAELPSIYRRESFRYKISTDNSNLDNISFRDLGDTSLEVFNETGVNIANWKHDLGDDDPMNWSSKKKLLNVTYILLVCILS
ncbi:hypothetical protein B5807_00460 [Epicoccum nigrum]|jgi:hypothetical protein|uniref:Uncharacterized protein n=1 Tax=Epicoccum nigrum TaxID=105696 RepID=A0A1Y2MH03_EPING|nr:hypothetical protein B5807_00460 [Epicoccum nigrum]